MGKKNFFGLFSKKDSEKLNNVKILSFNVTGYDGNPLYFWKLPKCEMEFIAKDGKVYTMHSLFDEFSMTLTININGLSDIKTRLIGRIKPIDDSSYEFIFDRIDSEIKNIGIGTSLMQMMFKIFMEFEHINNIAIKRIHGAIGVNGDDTPEVSMKLYESFDNKEFQNRKISLNRNGFNTVDCNLEYYII